MSSPQLTFIPYGFCWGQVKVTRLAILPRDVVVIGLTTPRHKDVQIRVTKTGAIRIWFEGREVSLNPKTNRKGMRNGLANL